MNTRKTSAQTRALEYRFPGQHANEVVLEIVHRHWFNIFFHFLVVVLLAIFFIGGYVILPYLFPQIFQPEYQGLFLFIQNTFFIFLWLYGFLIWIDYYFDTWIITSERVINIEQKGLFVRETNEVRYGRVQDVTCEVSGLIPTVLNFGDLHIHSASHEHEIMVFRQVPDPYRIRDRITGIAKHTPEHRV